MARLPTFFARLFSLVLPIVGLQTALRDVETSHPMNEVRIAAVQFEIQGNQTAEQLLVKLEAAVSEAVAAKADCIVFPELVTFDTWRVNEIESHLVPSPQEIEETRRIATEITPVFLRGMAELAEKYQVDILAGTTPRIDGSSIFNSAHLFFRDGSSFRQDKFSPTDWELKAGISPGSELASCDTRWGNCEILTCYDIEFPERFGTVGFCASRDYLRTFDDRVGSGTTARSLVRTGPSCRAPCICHRCGDGRQPKPKLAALWSGGFYCSSR